MDMTGLTAMYAKALPGQTNDCNNHSLPCIMIGLYCWISAYFLQSIMIHDVHSNCLQPVALCQASAAYVATTSVCMRWAADPCC